MIRIALTLCLMAGWGTVMMAQGKPTPATALLVLAKDEQMLAIVDPAKLQVVTRIPVGPEPHEVIASDDGRTAWVTNYRNGSEHTITVVDLVGQRVTKTIDLGALWGPHGLAVSGGKVYFTAERAKTIGRLDPATETVDWVLGTGEIGTHMLWVSRDGGRIVTVNVGAGTLSLLTRRADVPGEELPAKLSKQGGVTTRDGVKTPDWDEAVVKVGGYPEGFDVLADADGNPVTIWVANAVEGTISVVDWATKRVVGTLPVGLPTANRLRFTPDGKVALVSRQKSGDLAMVNVASQTVVAQIAVGSGAAGVLVTPDGRTAYVSCSPDNWVRVVDLPSGKVRGKIEPGRNPDGLAWAVRR